MLLRWLLVYEVRQIKVYRSATFGLLALLYLDDDLRRLALELLGVAFFIN